MNNVNDSQPFAAHEDSPGLLRRILPIFRWLIPIVIVLLVILGFYLPQISPYGYYTHPDAYSRMTVLILVLRLYLPGLIALIALLSLILSIFNRSRGSGSGFSFRSLFIVLAFVVYLIAGTLFTRDPIFVPNIVQTNVFEVDSEQYKLRIFETSSTDSGTLDYSLDRCTTLGLSCNSVVSGQAKSGPYGGSFSAQPDQILQDSEISLDTSGDCIRIMKGAVVDAQWCAATETASYPAPLPTTETRIEPEPSPSPEASNEPETSGLPVNENLLQNPGFDSEIDAGLQFWTTDITAVSQVNAGVVNLQFLTEEGSGFYQTLSNVTLTTEQAMITWVSVSNPEDTAKQFILEVSYLDVIAYSCAFTVPGNSTDLTYAMRFKPQQEWNEIRVGIRQTENFAIGNGLNFDNINLRYRPNLQVTDNRICVDPTENEE